VKLHRLVLTNYRGVAHREIDFPDHGVVVVCGANEVGKTSMIEALDLLLQYKDRSGHKDVKVIKPTHADVGAEVAAEITTGPYRFSYRKRFHKKCETQLTILEPRREQLTGDEAHERVVAMLEETVDTRLWHAQRVLQATSTAAVDLSGCDALSRALDVAAGESSDLSGAEPLLIERIEAEYKRYFTPTGRPTGEWAAAIARLDSAKDQLAGARAAAAEVDDRVRRHGELTTRLAELDAARPAVADRCARAKVAAAELGELEGELHNAGLLVAAAQGPATATAAALTERLGLQSELQTRTAAVDELKGDLAAAERDESAALAVVDKATAAAQEAALALTDAQARQDLARGAVESVIAQEEAGRIAGRLTRIDTAERERAALAQQLAAVAITADVLADIESATVLVGRCEAQLAATAATVEFVAAADLDLSVGGQRIALAAGDAWTAPATATTVELPGLVSVRIDLGAGATEVQAKLDAAQRLLAESLEQGGVADLAAARVADQKRRELVAAQTQLQATIAALSDGEDVERLRARLAELRAGSPAVDPPAVDPDAARGELLAADAALAAARDEAQARQQTVANAIATATEITTRAAVLRARIPDAVGELEGVAAKLTALRAVSSDEAAAAAATAAAEGLRTAGEVLAVLRGRYEAAKPTEVAAECESAVAAAEALDVQCAEVERMLSDIVVALEVMGTEGRHSNLADAELAVDRAGAEHDRIGTRARAAELLRSVMSRHRDDTRARYVEPFRAEIERLGRPVFGSTFQVEVDSDLRICNRTLDDRTVPYDSLSGGAREQLGILARLAGAALVAKEDTVPVVIDDALGFADPDRLRRMAAVFDSVGNHGQLIVLTCTPGRYDGIDGAHVIELTA